MSKKLSTYAFNNYGSDAKLYNRIHDLEAARDRVVEAARVLAGFEADIGTHAWYNAARTVQLRMRDLERLEAQR